MRNNEFWLLVIFLLCCMWIDDKAKYMTAAEKVKIESKEYQRHLSAVIDSCENIYDVAREVRKLSGKPANYTEQ